MPFLNIGGAALVGDTFNGTMNIAGALTRKKLIQKKTGNYVLVDGTDADGHFHSMDATGGVGFTIPLTTTLGFSFTAEHINGTGVTITIPAGHFILDGYAGVQYGSATSAKVLGHTGNFAHITLRNVGVNAAGYTLWHVEAKSGTWTVVA